MQSRRTKSDVTLLRSPHLFLATFPLPATRPRRICCWRPLRIREDMLAAGLTARHATTTADNLSLSLAAKRFPVLSL